LQLPEKLDNGFFLNRKIRNTNIEIRNKSE
jgi:hypothetical protein